LTILISFILIYEFQNEFKTLNFPQTLKILRNVENITIVIMFISGMTAISFLTLYDLTIKKYLSLNISYSKAFKIGWISGSINNFIGLGGLVGASLRTFLYEKEDVDTKTAIISNIYIVLSNITGLSILILLGFLKLYDFSPLLRNNKLYTIVLIGFVLYLPLYFLIDKIPVLKKKFLEGMEPVSLKFKLSMISSSILDWVMATLFFTGIIMFFSSNLTPKEIIPIYLVSITLGIISFLPSGLGSFDISAFAGLKLIGATSENALAGIMIYRLFYYIVPWTFSMLLFLSKLIQEKGKKKKDLRLANNKVESGELEFKILNPPFDKKLFNQLKEVSDEWLGKRKERDFSIGWFDESYLNRSPIAIIKKDDKIIAFANLMPLYDNQSMSIDLMRSKNDIPSGTMDALFIRLMEWSKSQGYTKYIVSTA